MADSIRVPRPATVMTAFFAFSLILYRVQARSYMLGFSLANFCYFYLSRAKLKTGTLAPSTKDLARNWPLTVLAMLIILIQYLYCWLRWLFFAYLR